MESQKEVTSKGSADSSLVGSEVIDGGSMIEQSSALSETHPLNTFPSIDDSQYNSSDHTMGLEDSEEPSMPIPHPNVAGPVLELVIEWLNHHKDDPVKEEKEDDGERRSDDIPQWDQDFLKDKPQQVLFEILLAANYLGIKELQQTCCKTVANMLKGKSPEEIRTHFNIKNDFTPEEEEQIRKENAWCEN